MKESKNELNSHYRFFVDPGSIHGDLFVSKDRELINQVKKVFRLKAGSKITVLDGSGYEYSITISNLEDGLGGNVINKRKMEERSFKINMFCPVLKGDHLELVLQKGTEMGIDGFYPTFYQKSIVKDVSSSKLSRFRKILKEASEQSSRGKIPFLGEPINFSKAIGLIGNGAINLFADQDSIKSVFDFEKEIKRAGEINIFIGPEGDFSDKEKDVMREMGFFAFNLGPNRLRSETACLFSTGLIAQTMLK